jgi:hypothetical protein
VRIKLIIINHIEQGQAMPQVLNDELIDRCAIFQESAETLGEFKRSMPNWPILVGYLLSAGAEPEKITLDIVWSVALDYNTIENLEGKGPSISDLVDKYGLRSFNNDSIRIYIIEESINLDKQFFENLKGNETLLYDVHPRMYEEIIAAILMDMGCDVQLTTATKDGGRDILAAFQTPFGKLLTIVECKRYKPERKIGIDLVERFLWVVDRNDKASFGLIATTSFFSADAQVIANNYRYRLKLKDFYDIREWIGKYGSWTKDDNSEIWIPETYSTPKKADAGDGK